MERYEQLRRVAAEIAAALSGMTAGRIEYLFSNESGYATLKIDITVRFTVVDPRGDTRHVRKSLEHLGG